MYMKIVDIIHRNKSYLSQFPQKSITIAPFCFLESLFKIWRIKRLAMKDIEIDS